MRQLIVFILQASIGTLAHPLAGELDYLSFSLLPNENLPSNPSTDNPEAYDLDLFYEPLPSDVETSYASDIVPSDSILPKPADFAQPNSYLWEPLTPNIPVSPLSTPLDQETTNAIAQSSQQSQFIAPGIDLAFSPTSRICARSAEKGDVCAIRPNCEEGKTEMCCSKVTEYGRPTECTPCLSYLDGFPLSSLPLCELTNYPMQTIPMHSNVNQAMASLCIVVTRDS